MEKKMIKIIQYVIVSVVIVLVLGLWGGSEKLNLSSKGIENKAAISIEISGEEAQNIINNEENIIILDVRTIEEYETGHIKNSMLIPINDLEQVIESKILDKEQKILVYCRSGNRSKIAAEILVDLGYSKVYDFGGINSWDGEIVK